MATFNSFEALMNSVKKNIIPDVQENEVLETVKEVYKEHIERDVYNAYTPKKYERRNQNGGLSDENNITGEVVGNTLEVMNIGEPNKSLFGTEFNSSFQTQFASWIEHGEAGNTFNGVFSSEPWANPRHFTENTIKDLRQSKKHITALKKGFTRHGVGTK